MTIVNVKFNPRLAKGSAAPSAGTEENTTSGITNVQNASWRVNWLAKYHFTVFAVKIRNYDSVSNTFFTSAWSFACNASSCVVCLNILPSWLTWPNDLADSKKASETKQGKLMLSFAGSNTSLHANQVILSTPTTAAAIALVPQDVASKRALKRTC